VLAAILLLVICLSAVDSSAQHARPAIIVGGDTVGEGAVLFRMKQDRCLSDTLADETKAAVELVSTQLEYEVLKRAFGEVPPDSIVQQMAGKLPKVTQDSAALACVTNIGDTASFLMYFVRPTLVNPRLFVRFYTDSMIHRQTRDSTRAIFERLIPHPELFLTYRLDTITIKRKTQNNSQSLGAGDLEALPIVRNVLSKLTPGKLWPEIIESEYDCSIVMLASVTDSAYHALAVRVAKRPFDPWFREYVKYHVSIEFFDKRLEREIRLRYPALWWLTHQATKL
jgi:hypothetical protein